MTMTLRFGSLCSGIEAASQAWQPLGWTPVFYSEIAPFPCAVLAHHHPNVPNHGDMTRFEEWPDADINVLVGGTPCQSFSVAGLRGGMADSRGNLALVYLAVARRYRPQWLVWENVPGVLSSNGGRDFGSFLGGLVELGYGFCYRVLDAQYFGLAQRRKRVFVVGCLGDWRRAAAVLLEPESLRGDSAPRREAGKGIANAITERPDRGGGNSEGQRLVAHALRAEGFDASEDGTGRGIPLVPEVSPTLRAGGNRTGGDRPPGTDVDTCETLVPVVSPALKARDAKGPSSDGDGDGDGAPLIPVCFSCKDHGADVGELAPTLRAMGHTESHANAGGQVAVAFHNRQDPDVSGDVTHPLGARDNGLGLGMQVRRLTPTECERLQGFPDGYTQVPLRNKAGRPNGKWAKDGPRYAALGNSMAVPVMSWIGRQIERAHRLAELERAA